MTWDHVAERSGEKPSAQGEITIQAPTSISSHSSHSAKAVRAATAMAPTTTPLIQALVEATMSVEKASSHGEMNSRIARTRLTQS